MILHQSRFGQVIQIPSEVYFTLTDQELEELEERFAGVEKWMISLGGEEKDLEE